MRELIGRKVGGGVFRAAFAKRRGWEEVRWQRWANGEVSEMGRRRGERDGGYGSVGWFQVAARMRWVEWVANWVTGDVGAVYDGRDSKGLSI